MSMPTRRRGLFVRKSTDFTIKIFSMIAVLAAVAAMLWILGSVVMHGIGALDIEFFINPSQPYGTGAGGIANALLGTILITLGAALFAVVPGICAGVFLSEYRDFKRLTGFLRFSANVMMGVPSVLAGLFIYTLLVVPTGHFSGLAGSVALAVIMFPVIMRTTEEMLAMVPYALRESALALGMTRTRTTLRIVCRSARNGLLTGILLSLSRVAGETAPLLFTAMFADSWPTGFFDSPTASMPVLITEYTTNSPFEAMHQAGWGAALTVMALVLFINIATRIFFREKNHAH